MVCSEFVSELDEIVNDIAPRLAQFGENPAFLVEENFDITKDGYLQNKQTGYPTALLATSYFGILETLRKMGLDVYCTRDLNASIWWMVAMHGYLSKNHYPKHRKYFSLQEQAVGMMTAVPGLGPARAEKALAQNSIRSMANLKKIPGLTETQSKKFKEVLMWRAD